MPSSKPAEVDTNAVAAPWQADMLMGVIGADGQKHCLFSSREEEDAAVARSPLKVAEDLMALAARVGAFIPHVVKEDARD